MWASAPELIYEYITFTRIRGWLLTFVQAWLGRSCLGMGNSFSIRHETCVRYEWHVARQDVQVKNSRRARYPD